MFRPYRHIPTADLVKRRDALAAEVQWYVINNYTMLVVPVRKELRRVSRELDRRSEETL